MDKKVKEQRVELIELFYDLIYVYAISKLTGLLTLKDFGWPETGDILRYFVLFFVILQAWLYLTNYVNRYGKWRWYEYGITVVNMIAAVYLANTISTAWEDNYVPFNIAMLVMLLTVTFLYCIQIKEDTRPEAAINSVKILVIVCFVYILGIIFIFIGFPQLVLWLDVIAVLLGAFLPFFIRGNFDHSIISFPHLAERFELLTIITFGEGVVGMTAYFDVEKFSILPILIFMVIISMFGCYVVQIHYLVDHHRVDRALRLMFSHYFIVISVNLMTVGIHLLYQTERIPLFVPILLVIAEVTFFVAIMTNHTYYKSNITLTKNDRILLGIIQLLGIVIIVISRSSIYGIVGGALLITVSSFVLLIRKYK